jgi:hypothetical protein
MSSNDTSKNSSMANMYTGSRLVITHYGVCLKYLRLSSDFYQSQRQLGVIQSERIRSVFLVSSYIVVRVEGCIVPKGDAAQHHSKLHKSNILAGTSELSTSKWYPRCFLRRKSFPPLGNELQRLVPIARVSIYCSSGNRDDSVWRNVEIIYLQSSSRGQA